MRTGEGFLLVYSITSRNSFQEISILYEQILRIRSQDSFPVIIVGNKSDFMYERQVPLQGVVTFSFLPNPTHFTSSLRGL